MSDSSIKMPPVFGKLLLATQAHLGGVKVTKPMKKYIYGERQDKVSVFDLKKTWDKFILAARAFCGLNYGDDVTVISCKTFGKKPVLKFAETTGAKSYTGRFIPGSFTNTTIPISSKRPTSTCSTNILNAAPILVAKLLKI